MHDLRFAVPRSLWLVYSLNGVQLGLTSTFIVEVPRDYGGKSAYN